MNDRTTRVMLAMVILLLSALLVKDSVVVPARASQHTADPAGVVRARSFEVVDERGEVRAQLFLGQDGDGTIRLRDKSGNVRVKLGASTDGYTGLLLMDQNVTPAVQLVTGPSGTSLSLTENKKKKRITASSR